MNVFNCRLLITHAGVGVWQGVQSRLSVAVVDRPNPWQDLGMH